MIRFIYGKCNEKSIITKTTAKTDSNNIKMETIRIADVDFLDLPPLY